MGAWLKRVWSDEDAFTALVRRLWAFGIYIAGGLIQAGVIPTGVENGGQYGWAVAGLGLLVPSRPIAPKT